MKKKILLSIICMFSMYGFMFSQSGWVQKSDFLGGVRFDPAVFVINNKAYIGTGKINNVQNSMDLWEYDPLFDTYTQKADFGGGNRTRLHAFTIGNKGYMGLGIDSIPWHFFQDFWEYDPILNSWTQVQNFPGIGRTAGEAFSIGNKGYIVAGFGEFYNPIDVWEFNPVQNTWVQKTNFPGYDRQEPSCFVINQIAYLGLGLSDQQGRLDDFWAYDVITDSWTQIATFPIKLYGAAAFSIGDCGFITTGVDHLTSNVWTNHTWTYNPNLNSWTQIQDFGGSIREDARGFTINGKGYVCTGMDVTGYLSDMWEYTPDSSCLPLSIPESNITTTIFPNPFNSKCEINFSTHVSNVTLNISNGNGQIVKTINNFSGYQYLLERENLISGQYYIDVILKGNKISRSKLMIN